MGTVPKRGRGVEARLRCNEFPLYVFRGGAGEASSAGYGREAVKMPVYMPWPQSGRMQYEKIKNQRSGVSLRGDTSDCIFSREI
jgi:hypothetical protein